MADITQRLPDNTPGPYYVDKECIACDNCKVIAPDHFRLTEDYDHAIVYNQPSTKQELERCMRALKACPVFSIGNNG